MCSWHSHEPIVAASNCTAVSTDAHAGFCLPERIYTVRSEEIYINGTKAPNGICYKATGSEVGDDCAAAQVRLVLHVLEGGFSDIYHAC
jgi:hypothetical protein